MTEESTQAGQRPSPVAMAPPVVSLPPAGGAIRGIGEKFSANPVTGTGSVSVPVAVSPGRGGLAPELSLSYDSGNGNGPFGFGWELAVPAISRRTDRGLPRYDGSDVFLISGAEDLVPALDPDAGWQRVTATVDGHRVDRYRPRTEGLFARIERWTRLEDGDTHWRVTSRDDVTSWYGLDANSRIHDPRDPGRVFTWLISRSQDDRGNRMEYGYAVEDGAGVDLAAAHERHRDELDRSANRYLKWIRYGNRVSYLVDPGPAEPEWLFEVVFDYGEHDHEVPLPVAAPGRRWTCRSDPFSSYRAGFEVRSYRLCRRILMFHHFPDEPDVGADCVVRSTELEYRSGEAVGSFLTGVTSRGWRRSAGGYLTRTLPPLEFGYSPATVNGEVGEIDPTGDRGRWIDLDGEGISGLLIDGDDGGWWYRPNLGDARLGRPRRVAPAPSPVLAAAGARRGLQLLDLAGDGQLDVANFEGQPAGFFERTRDGGWESFAPFASLPRLNWADPNLRFVDLDGDGLVDILVTEDEAVTWYPSEGERGFAAGRRVAAAADEQHGPRVVFAEPGQSLHLADLTGDGLADLVRVRNGEVCYWPNLGYGRFGAKVTMDGAPFFDRAELFDPRRLRLADVDGSGPVDLIYLAGDRTRVYLNHGGDSWSPATVLAGTPPTPDPDPVSVVDLFGSGTACLVWPATGPTDDRRGPRYLDLMGGIKPHLLVRVVNNLGHESRIGYLPSTHFYLADRAAGRPWLTRLPFPVQVVSRVEQLDLVAGTRSVSRYAYHHGCYDGREREFRGFAHVEQWDAEEVPGAGDLPPVWTRTWFHTGMPGHDGALATGYAGEYWAEPGLTEAERREALLPDTELPAALLLPGGSTIPHPLTAAEAVEAARALKGTPLRQEVYALDGSAVEALPYHVIEWAPAVAALQPRTDGRPAVFLTHPRETLVRQYERALFEVAGPSGPERRADPRVTHELVLDVDGWGDVTRSASVAYGRRHPGAGVDPRLPEWAAQKLRAAQTRRHVMVTVTGHTEPVDVPTAYRGPLPYQSSGYELVGVAPAGARFGAGELRAALDTAGELAFEEVDSQPAGPHRRLLGRERTLFWRDDLTGPLPAGQCGTRALPYQRYALALTPSLRAALYQRDGVDLVPDPAATLVGEGGYAELDGAWWVRSGHMSHAPERFYLPTHLTDPFGAVHETGYDPYDLLVAWTRDPVGNLTTAGERDPQGSVTGSGLDYRVLQPWLVCDANRNRSMVAYDALGLVAATAVAGKPEDGDGDRLDGVEPDLTEAQLAGYLADPLPAGPALLGSATSRVVADPLAYHRTRDDPAPRPMVVATLARETHHGDLGTGEQSRITHSFAYTDGRGRELQRVSQAASGPWRASGWTVLNNKDLPVRTYEPFFTTTHDWQPGQAHGVSTVACYDPSGWAVATLHPEDTFDKGVADPWCRALWDANDTVLLDPRTDPDVRDVAAAFLDDLPAGWQTWYAQRAGGGLGAREQAAAAGAAAHAGTPALSYADSLGRTVLSVAHLRAENGDDELLATFAELDIEGNQRRLLDPAGRVAAGSEFDLLGRAVRETGIDTGETVGLPDATDAPLRVWDARGYAVRTEYDPLRRPVRVFASGGDGSGGGGSGERLVEATVWGEAHPEAVTRNLRTRKFRVFDGAGLASTLECDFKGNVRRSARTLVGDWQAVPDWTSLPAVGDPELVAVTPAELAGGQFVAESAFDAGNRLVSGTAPDGSRVRYGYDVAGLLATVDVAGPASGDPQWTPTVTGIEYTALGTRSRAELGNGSHTDYAYHPRTFRLTRLTTLAGTAPVQDLRYTYDPVGNLTQVADGAQQTVFFAGAVVAPDSWYAYDPLYRLVRAEGREHAGQQTEPAPDWRDSGRAGLPHPHDGQAMRRYVERFRYDPHGNLTSVTHSAGGAGWTRAYHYAGPDNRLTHTQVGSGPVQPYAYDAGGDMVSMPHLPELRWDHRRCLVFADRGGGGSAHYQYAGAGERVRKVLARLNGTRAAERIYLGGFELYREYDGAGGTVTLARTTLHVRDGQSTVLMVDTRTEGSDGSPAHLLRYQYADHLGGTALELDAAGDVLTYEEYYPFGAASFASHRGAAAPPAKRYRYAGKERDEETGLSGHGARYYAPWLGRWTSADPAGVRPGELTGYVYCANRPTTLVDPDGASPQPAPHTSPPPGTRPGVPPMGVPPGLESRPPPPPSTPQPPTRSGPAGPGTGTRGTTTPRTGPGTSGGTGLRSPRRLLSPLEVFLTILLTPSNATTNYEVQYTDEDTGQTLTFRSLDELEGYKNQKRAAQRRQEEERQAPGPADKRGPAQAPGDPSKPGPAVEPDLRLPPAEAPGAERDESVREAPGAADPGEAAELGPLDRPLTDPEKADVLKTLKQKKPLSKAQKELLRGEARWMWQHHTKGKGPQPGKKWQLHHLVALEFIHLFKGELYPNAPKNLYLMQTQSHQDLHWIIGKILRDIVASGGKITREILEKISEGTLKHWPGRTMWTK